MVFGSSVIHRRGGKNLCLDQKRKRKNDRKKKKRTTRNILIKEKRPQIT
jgi:hypothetical protein